MDKKLPRLINKVIWRALTGTRYWIVDSLKNIIEMRQLFRAMVLYILIATSVQAGIIQLVSFSADKDSFTSKWNWFEGTVVGMTGKLPAGWATNPVSESFGTLPFWEVTLQGFDPGVPMLGVVGDLRDESRHATRPDDHDDDTNGTDSSFFDYPSATAGKGPIISFFPHPQ